MRRQFTDEQKALARAALTQIIDHPETWYQGMWATQTDCGTAYCLAGHTVNLAHSGRDIEPVWCGKHVRTGRIHAMAVWIGDALETVSIPTTARTLLGLTQCESSAMFDAKNTLDDLERYVKAVENDEPLIGASQCECRWRDEADPEPACVLISEVV